MKTIKERVIERETARYTQNIECDSTSDLRMKLAGRGLPTRGRREQLIDALANARYCELVREVAINLDPTKAAQAAQLGRQYGRDMATRQWTRLYAQSGGITSRFSEEDVILNACISAMNASLERGIASGDIATWQYAFAQSYVDGYKATVASQDAPARG